MREEKSGDQTGTKIDVNDVRHIPENFQKHQCDPIKQAKEHSMQTKENRELSESLNCRNTSASKIDDNTLTHTEPYETAQDAEKINKEVKNTSSKAKEHGMHTHKLSDHMNTTHESQSEINDDGLTHPNPNAEVRGAEKNEDEIHGASLEAKRARMQVAISKRKELLKSGEVRSSAEKFIEEPSIGRAVRRFCWECCGFSYPLSNTCPNANCALWIFRHGKLNPFEEELPVWQDAHKRWLQKVGEWKPGTSDGNEPDETDEESDD